jgi:hypothetical protein
VPLPGDGAEADIFLSGQPQKIYDALKAPKQLVKFTSEDGPRTIANLVP